MGPYKPLRNWVDEFIPYYMEIMGSQQPVGGWTTPLKNVIVKLDHFPRDQGENKQYLSCHHLEKWFWSHVFFPSPKDSWDVSSHLTV